MCGGWWLGLSGTIYHPQIDIHIYRQIDSYIHVDRQIDIYIKQVDRLIIYRQIDKYGKKDRQIDTYTYVYVIKQIPDIVTKTLSESFMIEN